MGGNSQPMKVRDFESDDSFQFKVSLVIGEKKEHVNKRLSHLQAQASIIDLQGYNY